VTLLGWLFGGSGPTGDVILDVEFEGGLLFLVVRNIGDAPAHCVRCRFGQAIRGAGGDVAMNELPLFTQLAFLAPGGEVRTLLDSSAAYFARGEATEFTVTVEFALDSGVSRSRQIAHDLSVYRDLLIPIRGQAADPTNSGAC